MKRTERSQSSDASQKESGLSAPVSPPESDLSSDRRAGKIIVAVAAIAFAILAGGAARIETPTVDEFAHLPAGCAYWKWGRLDLYSKNPPLLKYWMALPVIINVDTQVPAVTGSPLGWGPWEYGTQFMEANRARYFGLFFRARLSIVLLGLFTGLILYRWGGTLFGHRSAACATALFFLSPTILAHAHLATVDVGCMFAIFLTIFVLRWAYMQPARWRILLVGVAWGAALSIKFTAVLLLPIIVSLQLMFRMFAWRAPRAAILPTDHAHDPRDGRKADGGVAIQATSSPRWTATRAAFVDVVLVCLSALLVVNLLMGSQGTGQSLGQYQFDSAFCRRLQSVLPGALPVPLPREYVAGFDAQKVDTEAGEFGSYLLGQWSKDGWWYYNFVALLVKEPVAILALVLAGSIWWLFRRTSRAEAWTIFLPAIGLALMLSLFNKLNIGIRYLLPIYPFAFLAVAAACAWFERVAKRRWLRLIPMLIVVYQLILAVLTYPAYLSFFNGIAGGSDKGADWLLDSNLDWGQDLYRVRDATQKLQGDEPINLLYFGHVDPALYGIRYGLVPSRPISGLVCVSVNFLKGYPYVVISPDGRMLPVPQNHLAWLADRKPVIKLGSIWVFHIP